MSKPRTTRGISRASTKYPGYQVVRISDKPRRYYYTKLVMKHSVCEGNPKVTVLTES